MLFRIRRRKLGETTCEKPPTASQNPSTYSGEIPLAEKPRFDDHFFVRTATTIRRSSTHKISVYTVNRFYDTRWHDFFFWRQTTERISFKSSELPYGHRCAGDTDRLTGKPSFAERRGYTLGRVVAVALPVFYYRSVTIARFEFPINIENRSKQTKTRIGRVKYSFIAVASTRLAVCSTLFENG